MSVEARAIAAFAPGDRVELGHATEWWKGYGRYGVVVFISRRYDYVGVKLDRSGETHGFLPHDLAIVAYAPPSPCWVALAKRFCHQLDVVWHFFRWVEKDEETAAENAKVGWFWLIPFVLASAAAVLRGYYAVPGGILVLAGVAWFLFADCLFWPEKSVAQDLRERGLGVLVLVAPFAIGILGLYALGAVIRAIAGP